MMTNEQKQELHTEAQTQLEATHLTLKSALAHEQEQVEKLEKILQKSAGADRLVQEKLFHIRQESAEHLSGLLHSPYFVRCDIRFTGTTEIQSFYFAKHTFPTKKIFSWITPAARLRYEEIGPCAYPRHDGTLQQGELLRKDQFMIVEDQIKFMTSENSAYPRTLIYQEYFSKQKQQFALTDIVAQMEKAQDAVIRAEPKGSLLISGPAGSGKTTLALHRLAYLAQSPETMNSFPSKRIVVFVQDAASQAYFSALLPELGIHNVLITTFEAWASTLLGLQITPTGLELKRDKNAYDEYQFQKNLALTNLQKQRSGKDLYQDLEKIYLPYFTSSSKRLFAQQREEQSLDRFDITLLLLRRLHTEKQLATTQTVSTRGKDGRIVTKLRVTPLRYACVAIDEVQNYLPTQIRLLQSCIEPETAAMLYIGDLAQQTKLFTLRDWQHVQEDFTQDRHVHLTKAYRNTRQIITYLRSCGFSSSIESTRDGQAVQEITHLDQTERCNALSEILKNHQGELVGVLSRDAFHLAFYQERLQPIYPGVRFMTIEEAQGVEFSTVCLMDMQADTAYTTSQEPSLAEEQRRVERDTLYVALTRAMDNLYVIDRVSLTNA